MHLKCLRRLVIRRWLRYLRFYLTLAPPPPSLMLPSVRHDYSTAFRCYDRTSLGLTIFEVATRAELPGDGDDWHAMRDGRAIGLPASRSKELGAVLRQVTDWFVGNISYPVCPRCPPSFRPSFFCAQFGVVLVGVRLALIKFDGFALSQIHRRCPLLTFTQLSGRLK